MKKLAHQLLPLGGSILGTIGVLWVVVVMNGRDIPPPEREETRAVSFDVAPPEPVQTRTTPTPTPPPQVVTPQLPPPPALMTGLGGLDFGLEGLNLGNDTTGSQLLDVDENVVMTAETVDVAPRPTSRSSAPYPSRARARGVEGEVVLSFLVTESGTVTDIVVVQASPAGVFEDTARGSVSEWRFEPGRYQERAVPVRVEYVVRFELS